MDGQAAIAIKPYAKDTLQMSIGSQLLNNGGGWSPEEKAQLISATSGTRSIHWSPFGMSGRTTHLDFKEELWNDVG